MRIFKLLFILTLFSLIASANEYQVELKRDGWNLVSICQDINATDIDMSNIEEIQSQDGKAIYSGQNAQYSNLNSLKAGYGYWVKASKGTIFKGKISSNPIKMPLLRDGWNLMGVCEDISKDNLAISSISEIQSQDGKAIYSGENAQYSNLDILKKGYGYWIKGSKNTLFDAKTILSIPSEFQYEAINNKGQTLEAKYGDYTVKLLSDTKIEPNSQSNHMGISISIDNNQLETLNIQSDYNSHNLIAVVYDNSGNIVAISNIKNLDSNNSITKLNITLNGSSNNQNSSNKGEYYQGLKLFASPLKFEDFNLEPIDDDYFNSLSKDNKELVANKLLSALYYGLPHNKQEKLINSGKFISTIKELINKKNSDLKSVDDIVKNRVTTNYRLERYKRTILTRLFHLSLGKEYINRWSAYILTQTILFTPAYELSTVGGADIPNVYNNLVRYMDDGYSMQLTTFLHMISNDNWKRFRSPEDNGREMLEIYTLDFNDSHVPLAATALKNWKLDRSDKELVIGLDENYEPIQLFDTTIINGFDFYRELVKSSSFLKGVTTRLVDLYFNDFTKTQKESIVEKIVSSNPEQYQDILLQIVFSKEFLINSKRVKSFEETFFGIAKKISFIDSKSFFGVVTSYLDNMHQSTMKYKLGRHNIPIDTLSFAYYHKFIREYLLTNYQGDTFNEYDSGWKLNFIDKSIPNTDTIEKLVDYLFVSVLGRHSNDTERDIIVEYCKTRGYNDVTLNNDRRSIAIVTMDYISRLKEVYQYQSIEE